jgi:hypothetical protein
MPAFSFEFRVLNRVGGYSSLGTAVRRKSVTLPSAILAEIQVGLRPYRTKILAKRSTTMLARVVEMNVLPDKTEMFRTITNNEILPLLKKNPGFVDWIVLFNEKTNHKLTSVLMFKSKTDIEKYERETYPTVMQKIRPLLKEDPRVEICTVETSTIHKISAGMAA